MKKRSYRAQKVNEVRWEEMADRVKLIFNSRGGCIGKNFNKIKGGFCAVTEL